MNIRTITMIVVLMIILIPNASAACDTYADIPFDNYADNAAYDADWMDTSYYGPIYDNGDTYLNSTQGIGGGKAVMIEDVNTGPGAHASTRWVDIDCFDSVQVFYKNDTFNPSTIAPNFNLLNSTNSTISKLVTYYNGSDYISRFYEYDCNNYSSNGIVDDMIIDESGWYGFRLVWDNVTRLLDVYYYDDGWQLWLNDKCMGCKNCNVNQVYIGTSPLGTDKGKFFADDFKLNMPPGEITDCTKGEKVLEFTIKAEEDPLDLITADLEMAFETWYEDTDDMTYYNFSLSGSDTYQVCIYPNGTKLYANAMMEYSEDVNYTARQYYMVNTTLSGSSYDAIDLYLLNDTLSDLITIYVQNPEGISQDDVMIKGQRLYLGENIYRTVVMGRTNFDGHDSIYMRLNDAFYRFVLEKDGEILRVFDPFKITDTNLILKTSPIGYGQWFSYINDFGWYCSHNDVTNITSCTYSDTGGNSQEICLLVKQEDLFNYTTICDYCETSTSGTLYCDLGDTKDNIYLYTLTVVFDETSYVLEHGYLDFTSSTTWGLMGVLVALMLFITCTFIGIRSPTSAMALAVVSLFISSTFGFIDIAVGSILGIAVVAAIIIYRMSS